MSRSPPLPELRISPVPGKGVGVFALRAFQVGELLMRFVGESALVDEIRDLDHWLQVGPDEFIGPSGGPDDSVNHACRPNCGLFEEEGGPMLRALQPVRRGEEITFDYSTWMSRGHWSLAECSCGDARCRGRVEDFAALGPRQREAYEALGCVPAFVLRGAPRPATAP